MFVLISVSIIIIVIIIIPISIVLVVCGSATSWILSNLSRSKGGLYGRLTAEIKFSPFTTTFSFTFRSDTYFLHNT